MQTRIEKQGFIMDAKISKHNFHDLKIPFREKKQGKILHIKT